LYCRCIRCDSKSGSPGLDQPSGAVEPHLCRSKRRCVGSR
jgi:hypothetical protein